MKIAVLAWILAAASSAQAAPGIAQGSATSFTSGKSVAGVAFEAAGRKGSKRVGGSGRSGKGGHYVGGRR